MVIVQQSGAIVEYYKPNSSPKIRSGKAFLSFLTIHISNELSTSGKYPGITEKRNKWYIHIDGITSGLPFHIYWLIRPQIVVQNSALLAQSVRNNTQPVKGGVDMANNDDGVSEEFKKKVEELCNRLGPKNKENNALWQLVSEICKEDVKD